MYQVDTRELRKKMIDADIATIAGLAEASGVDRNTIGAILSEKARPSSAVWISISLSTVRAAL